MKCLRLAAFFLLATIPLAAQSTFPAEQPKSQVEELIRHGDALAGAGDFDNAINAYSHACAQSRADHPGTSEGCGSVAIAAQRGWTYFKKGDCRSLPLAEKDFREATTLEPGNAELHSWLGSVLMGEGGDLVKLKELNCGHSKREREAYLDQAWSQFRIALNLDSTNVMYRAQFVALSEVLKRKPEYDGGVAREPDKAELSGFFAQHPELQAADSAAPDSLESLKAQADRQLSVERHKAVTAEQDAVTAAKEAIRAQPTDGFAWRKLGDAYFQLGDYKNAYDTMQEAIEIFKERFNKAPLPHECEAMKAYASRIGQAPLVCHDEAPTIVSMLASSYGQLATICDKLHKKREAARYRDSALRAFDVLRMMQPSSQGPAENGAPRPAQPRPVPRAVVPCPSPVHEICQGPAYGSSDWRDYNRCRAGNRREDALYDRCVEQQRRER